jgi:hypothetical protein
MQNSKRDRYIGIINIKKTNRIPEKEMNSSDFLCNPFDLLCCYIVEPLFLLQELDTYYLTILKTTDLGNIADEELLGPIMKTPHCLLLPSTLHGGYSALTSGKGSVFIQRGNMSGSSALPASACTATAIAI